MSIQRQSFRLLLLEPDERAAKELSEIIMGSKLSHFEVLTKAKFEESFHLIRDGKFDLILFSLFSHPSESSVPSEIERFHQLIPETPFLIINGSPNLDFADLCIRNGAEDYLSRLELGENQLIPTIIHSINRHKRYQESYRKSSDAHFQTKLNAIGNLAIQTASQVSNPFQSFQDELEKIKSNQLEGMSHQELRRLTRAAEKVEEDLQDVVQRLRSLHEDFTEHQVDEKKLRILVVDDEETCTALIKNRLMSSISCEVETAFDGSSAYEKCTKSIEEGNRFDLIISDLRMPEMTGIELLEKLRSNPYFSNIPFLMVTSAKEQETVKKAINLKVTQYLIKPFQGKDFDEKIRRLRFLVKS